MKHEELLTQSEKNEIKQLKIEEKDERNIALANAAKARAYEMMMWLYAISISLLALLISSVCLPFYFVECVCYLSNIFYYQTMEIP